MSSAAEREGEEEDAGTIGLPSLQGNGCLRAALAVSSKQTDQVGWKQGSTAVQIVFAAKGERPLRGGSWRETWSSGPPLI